MERSEAIKKIKEYCDYKCLINRDNFCDKSECFRYLAIEALEKLEEIEKRKDIVPCSDCQEFECDGCFYKSVRYSM